MNTNKIIKAYLLSGLLLFLPSCAFLQKKQSQSRLLSKEQEAQLTDVPVMFDFVQCVQPQLSDQADVLHFESPSSRQEIVMFYEQEMERLGWRPIKTLDDTCQESVLLFEKPHNLAVVIVRDDSHKKLRTRIHFYSAPK